MNSLMELGITKREIEDSLESYYTLNDLNDLDIATNIDLLKTVGCTEGQCRNIILGNPQYLWRSSGDILKLIKKLIDLGLKELAIIFDSYPQILNKDDFEIDQFVDCQIKKGLSFEDTIDIINSFPYKIDEM